jgi:hypothetical protein
MPSANASHMSAGNHRGSTADSPISKLDGDWTIFIISLRPHRALTLVSFDADVS